MAWQARAGVGVGVSGVSGWGKGRASSAPTAAGVAGLASPPAPAGSGLSSPGMSDKALGDAESRSGIWRSLRADGAGAYKASEESSSS